MITKFKEEKKPNNKTFQKSSGSPKKRKDDKKPDSNKKAKKLKVNKALTGRLTDADTQDCNGTTNATIAIDINKGRLNSANAGLYTGTLTLIVAVE